MKLKSRYNFIEAALGPNFASEKLKDFKRLIDTSLSFVVMSMPGVGASYFLKYLACQDFARSARGAWRAYFIHVDFYELPNLTKHEFYKLFLFRLGGKSKEESDEQLFIKAKSILFSLSQKHPKIVIIFNRFDQLKREFDWNFLSNLQSLVNLAPGKIVLIFTSTRPLIEFAPDALEGGNLNFYSKILYFKPYSKDELKKLLKIEPEQLPPPKELERLLELSGGHNQLLHILLNSQKKQNLLLDQFVKQQMKSLIDYLDYHQRKQVQRIAFGKRVADVDDYLSSVGMVKGVGDHFELFTPLLAQYIKQNMPVKLPPQEAKLFKLLRANTGKLVTKDEIFETLWGKDPDKATDWALDALIYRLRKHPFINSNGYIIESHKKVGYTLIQT